MKTWQKLAAGGALAGAILGAFLPSIEDTTHAAYWDAQGRTWTICTGHTLGVKRGDAATDAQCAQYLRDDTAEATRAVDRCIRVTLTEPQRAAFVSAAFNLGPRVVCGSTLQRLANAGDITGACLQLTDALDKRGNAVGWTSPGSPVERGLRNRRTDERNLCLGYFR